MQEKKGPSSVSNLNGKSFGSAAGCLPTDIATTPRRLSSRVGNVILLYVADAFAKIWAFSENTESELVHYKYRRIFLYNIQLILNYGLLKWRHQIVGGDDKPNFG